MAAEYIVAGRCGLPPGETPWELDIQSSEGGLAIYEPAARYDAAGQAGVAANTAAVVGWTPRSIVFVRKAWELARVVAEELAIAIDGAVFCDADLEIIFDARGTSVPVASRRELEERLLRAFRSPQPFFDRWEREERERFAAEKASDPAAAAANDWSDVDPSRRRGR
jgi:hypothetical protein